VPSETPTAEATETPTDTPPPTEMLTFTWTPADTATETPPPTETPVPDTPTQTVTITVTQTRTPPDTATPTHTPTFTSLPTQTPTPPGVPCPPSSIRARFNRSAIAHGNCIWFNSSFNPSKLGAGPTTIVVENQTVQFMANGHPFSVSVPRAVITFDANVASATTAFDPIGNQWITEVPLNFNRDVFLSGAMFPVVANLPGDIRPLTWTATFSSDEDRARLQWHWAAAVYTKCNTSLAALGVKPVDGNARNPYRNSDEAGTPEAIKRFVTAGARGDGQQNYTGAHTRPKSVRPCD
jgi:hypothetical protein